MTLSPGWVITTFNVDRCPPMPFPFDDPPTDVFYPPRPLPDEPLGELEQRWIPAREILAREGVHLPRKRIVINPWAIIILSAVVFAFGLALLATWAYGVTQPEPSPLTVSVMEDSPAAFTAVLLGLHGGGH